AGAPSHSALMCEGGGIAWHDRCRVMGRRTPPRPHTAGLLPLYPQQTDPGPWFLGHCRCVPLSAVSRCSSARLVYGTELETTIGPRCDSISRCDGYRCRSAHIVALDKDAAVVGW